MVIFGLGNPGRNYERTRHNLGFMVLDELAHGFRARFRNHGNHAEATIQLSGIRHALVKPLTYMNNSGEVVRDFLRGHDAASCPLPANDDFLVVCYDLALPFGRIRIRLRGSDGGHQGLASIIAHLQTGNFPRVRIGITPAPAGVDAADYVLSEFNSEERGLLPEIVTAGKDALVMIVKRGLAATMNHFNGRVLIEPPHAADGRRMTDDGRRK